MEENKITISKSTYDDLICSKFNLDVLKSTMSLHARLNYSKDDIIFEIPSDIIRTICPGIYERTLKRLKDEE